MERKTPRFRRRFESFAKKPSHGIPSQEQEVGTKWGEPPRSFAGSLPGASTLEGGRGKSQARTSKHACELPEDSCNEAVTMDAAMPEPGYRPRWR